MIALFIALATAAATPPVPTTAADGTATCSYHTYQWSVERRRAEKGQAISKPYSQVVADERDPSDPRCSVCRQDQALVEPAKLGLPGVPAFLACAAHVADLRAALENVAKDGKFKVIDIVGYRVGRTRGAVVAGLRTEWSNHSFGAAIDVNARHNGLYDGCDVIEVTGKTIAGCHLRVGGGWDPDKRPASTVTKATSIYREITRFWKWGGEIRGAIRDTMHFSPTGY